MEQTFTDEEIRHLYEKKQEEQFNPYKEVIGAVYAIIILSGCFMLALVPGLLFTFIISKI